MRKKQRGIMRRLVFTYITIFAVIVVGIEVMAYFVIANISEQTAKESREQLCSQMAAQAANFIDTMDKIAEQIGSDSRIASMFNSLGSSDGQGNYFERSILDRLEIGSIVASYNGPNMLAWRISLYNEHGDFISSGAPVQSLSQASEKLASEDVQDMFAQIAKSPKNPLLLPPEGDRWSDVYTGQYVSLIYSLSDYYGSELYGAVEVQQPLELLSQRLSLDSSGGIAAFLLDGSGRQFWPEGSAYKDMDELQYAIASQELPQYGLTLALAQNRDSILRPFVSVFWLLLIGGGILVLAIVPVVYIVSRRISAPLVNLSRQVSTVSLGNLPDNWVVEGGIDEINELSLAFATMMERLGTAVVFEKKAYLQALQAQMNPHFLFNTLSMLSAMSMEGGNEVIVYACERLSNLMRYITDASASTLDMEIGSVKDYLEIMRLRYEDCFSYDIAVEGDLSKVPMPRLVLQPLAENCFEHAFKNVRPPWRVEISARHIGDEWELRVADNGCGFDEAWL
ncbi:MAG: histidine kinase, partial [Clostridiales bacterium]|nr:histidine kinase [Clostridiales bacterium]